MARIKVCGLATEASCDAVAAAGVDFAGFNLWPGSKRCVSPARAASLMARLPSAVRKVGLFVDPSARDVAAALEVCPFELLQFHGRETPDFCRSFGRPFIKAFRLRDERVIAEIAPYLDDEDHPFLVDAFVPGAPGGTGARANWDLALRAREEGRCMMLAGGLTPDNVTAAVERVRPWAVDVASGVESSPGCKAPALVGAFVAAVR